MSLTTILNSDLVRGMKEDLIRLIDLLPFERPQVKKLLDEGEKENGDWYSITRSRMKGYLREYDAAPSPISHPNNPEKTGYVFEGRFISFPEHLGKLVESRYSPEGNIRILHYDGRQRGDWHNIPLVFRGAKLHSFTNDGVALYKTKRGKVKSFKGFLEQGPIPVESKGNKNGVMVRNKFVEIPAGYTKSRLSLGRDSANVYLFNSQGVEKEAFIMFDEGTPKSISERTELTEWDLLLKEKGFTEKLDVKYVPGTKRRYYGGHDMCCVCDDPSH